MTCFMKTIESTVFLLAVTTLLAVGDGTARADGVLVMNTNAAIGKYTKAQEAFVNEIRRPLVLLDIEADRVDSARLAREITSANPRALYCIGSTAYQLAASTPSGRYLVVSSVINWKRFPLSGRTHGIANEVPASLQLTMVRYLFPDVRRIGVIYSKQYNKEWLDVAVANGRDRDLEIVGFDVARVKDVHKALESLPGRVDALWLTPDPVVFSSKEQILHIYSKADAARLPVFAHDPIYAELGAMLVVSADIPTIGRQAAGLVNDLINNKASTPGFQDPVGTEITVNLRKVEAYDVKINFSALGSVNRIIE